MSSWRRKYGVLNEAEVGFRKTVETAQDAHGAGAGQGHIRQVSAWQAALMCDGKRITYPLQIHEYGWKSPFPYTISVNSPNHNLGKQLPSFPFFAPIVPITVLAFVEHGGPPHQGPSLPGKRALLLEEMGLGRWSDTHAAAQVCAPSVTCILSPSSCITSQ